MKIKPGLFQSLTYIVTAVLLLYQFFWELTHCCGEGEKLQELNKFFTEGWLFLFVLASGSLLLISGFMRLINHPDANAIALIATLIGFFDFFYGFWLFLISLLFIFTNVKALIFALSDVMLLISFIISAREVVLSLRRKG